MMEHSKISKRTVIFLLLGLIVVMLTGKELSLRTTCRAKEYDLRVEKKKKEQATAFKGKVSLPFHEYSIQVNYHGGSAVIPVSKAAYLKIRRGSTVHVKAYISKMSGNTDKIRLTKGYTWYEKIIKKFASVTATPESGTVAVNAGDFYVQNYGIFRSFCPSPASFWEE